MKAVYKILIGLMYVFAAGHMLYTFMNVEGRASGEEQMWFFSGGLAMLFAGFINMIFNKVGGGFVRMVSLVTNLILLIFLIVLSVVIPEVQVIVLASVLLMTVIVNMVLSREGG
ncbi:hypothetical protein [Chitinophaga rhizosphaerae]|uniref:hypothetical protein n=1 Tax=Chitinophaga rhizosphaerae TaxID=1864947 RepID=UPI000F808E40|nr:hypothetical protein [Chitinophaga rhizosphaerae]